MQKNLLAEPVPEPTAKEADKVKDELDKARRKLPVSTARAPKTHRSVDEMRGVGVKKQTHKGRKSSTTKTLNGKGVAPQKGDDGR